MEGGILQSSEPLSFSDEPEGCLIFFFPLVYLISLREQALRTFSISFCVALGFQFIPMVTEFLKIGPEHTNP